MRASYETGARGAVPLILTRHLRSRVDVRIDYEALEQALLAYELGSFRRAADFLGIQPSAVSRRIRALEDTIGTSLFHRQTQGAQPTSAGIRLLPRIRRVVDEVRLIVRTGRLAGEGSEGSICIGVVASFAGGKARHLLQVFLNAHPGVELHVIEGRPRDHIGGVRALRMDAAFVVGQPPAPGCAIETLWSEPIMVVLPATHRLASNQVIAWSELLDERFLVSRMDPGPEIQDYVVQHLAALGHHPVVEPRAVGRDGLMALIGLQQGVSLVSGAEAEVVYPGIVFRPLEDDCLPYSVVWSEQNDNPILRRFMSMARRWSRERAAPVRPEESGAPLQTPDPSP